MNTEQVREMGDVPFRGTNPSPGIQNMPNLEMDLIKIGLLLASNTNKGEISTELINTSCA